LRGIFDIDKINARLDELKVETENPDLWSDTARAQKLMQEQSQLQNAIGEYKNFESDYRSNLEMAELADIEQDEGVLDDIESELKKLLAKGEKMQISHLFSGEVDANNCFLEINAGAGGTESHDWSSMMMRMYLRFADRLGFKSELLNVISGEDAGIKSCVLKISGHNAYGWFKTESGVHRLVRISPFNAAGKRMTSFASTWVYPEIDDNIEINIEEKDLRIDTFRSSGAGGQHVNTTDSAVRITHIPSGIVVGCQNDRSQHKNKASAMKMLRARLYEVELKKREDTASEQHAAKTDNGWGNQIRSYVLQPYQMVKDLRTECETSDTAGVLDGDLEKFVSASLSARASNKR
jgi:peptide chain release factor 2